MYLRTTRRRNQDGSVVEYLQLAENVWDPAKKRSFARIVHNFGRADRADAATLARLARSIRAHGLGEDAGTPVGAGEVEVLESRSRGGVHVARSLWEELGIGEVLRSREPRRRNGAPHERALFAMVVHRLLDPGSKRACRLRWLRDEVYLPEAADLDLGRLYRAMDFLLEGGEAVERAVFEHAAAKERADVELVFFDTTSVYFHVDEDDELRRRGHSKDDRESCPQVVIALAVTREGLPVRSWVFPGNTVDATTVERIKKGLSDWNLTRSVLVGDAGMDSEADRRALAKGLGRFILAMPAERLSAVQEVLARPGRFRKLKDELWVKEVVVGEGERRRRYVVLKNDAEARRQQATRKVLLEQLAEELSSLGSAGDLHPRRACALLSSKRFGRFLVRKDDGTIDIDEERVRRAGVADGRTVLLTNDDTVSSQDVALAYKAMALIETCFRKMKTTGLRIRPVYHWTAARIEAHVKLCVLALLLQRVAELRGESPWSAISHDLARLHATRCRIQGREVVRTTKLTARLVSLLDRLRVPKPPTVLPDAHGA